MTAAVKIPVRQRLLLINREQAHTRLLRHLLWLYSRRWMGQLPEHSVQHLPDGRIRVGAYCAHTSFWKYRIVRHEHPEVEPPSEELLAALRGEADAAAVFEEMARAGRKGEVK